MVVPLTESAGRSRRRNHERNDIGMKGRIVSKLLLPSLLALLSAPIAAHALARPSDESLCPTITGQVPAAYGPGDCSGNNFRSYDLSYLYPGLTLSYNSNAPFNQASLQPPDFGSNMTLSAISYVYLETVTGYPDKGTFVAGDGTVVDLEFDSAGRYRARNRDQLPDLFILSNNGVVTQYAASGDNMYKYQYTRTVDGRKEYELRSGGSMGLPQMRIGAKSLTFDGDTVIRAESGGFPDIQCWEQPSSPFCQMKGLFYPRSEIKKELTLSSQKDPKRWIKLQRDRIGRVILIKYADGTTYNLKYDGWTSRLTEETLTAPDGASETSTFLYDSRAELAVASSKGSSVRYIRNWHDRSTKANFSDGKVRETRYADYGSRRGAFMESMSVYLIGNEAVKLQDVTYGFTSQGYPLSMEYPEGARTIKVTYTYSYATGAGVVPTGYKKFADDRLEEEYIVTQDPKSWQPLMTALKNGSGQFLSQVRYTYNQEWPYLLRFKAMTEGPDKGTKETYNYSYVPGEETPPGNGQITPLNSIAVATYDRNGTALSHTKYVDGMLVLRRDLTAPSALQTATWKYDSEGRVLEEGLGQQKVEYRYDSQGRVVYEKGTRGDVRTITYDTKGFIATENTSFPGGSKCTRYEREFFDNNPELVQRLTRTTAYPAFTKIDVVEYDEVGKVVDSSHRTTPTTGSGGAC